MCGLFVLQLRPEKGTSPAQVSFTVGLAPPRLTTGGGSQYKLTISRGEQWPSVVG